MVVPVGGEPPTPLANLLSEFAVLTFAIIFPSDLTVGVTSILDENLVLSTVCPTTRVFLDKPENSIPKLNVYVAQDELKDKGTPVDSTTIKGWKNVLVGSSLGEVGPNLVPACLQTEEGLALDLPDKFLDRILLNMSNTLVGIFFSLCPTMEMVRKWVLAKWKLKGSVSVSVMPGALFLFKFTVEEDVAMVLSSFWTYGRCNLSLYRWKVGFDLTTDLQKTALGVLAAAHFPVSVFAQFLPSVFITEITPNQVPSPSTNKSHTPTKGKGKALMKQKRIIIEDNYLSKEFEEENPSPDIEGIRRSHRLVEGGHIGWH
ncbi:hypothetical protein SUGI_0626520 [Cryptomeria japonica]|nr:hypothetical protein SUGI_0626520 [Cryptomeria japonica]